MTPADVLREARSAGLMVRIARSGNLYVEPAKRLVPELHALLLAHKAELLDHLRHADDANDPPDPDRWCWPHTSAMNMGEIKRFTSRVILFMRRGLGAAQADDLADRLVIRDREGDDRVSCAECRHARAQACPSGSPLPLAMLHRCAALRPA